MWYRNLGLHAACGIVLACVSGACNSALHAAELLPFEYKVETYREKDSDTIAFSVRLEQPFLAEEFERNNYLRLSALDRSAYLIYPKEARFQQKHAEFFGRLRGSGVAKVKLAYEVVVENADGSRRIDVREGEIEISIPAEHGGSRGVFEEWARRQHAHFLDLLQAYPHESFFQYVLLQSQQRYGVAGPSLPEPPRAEDLETELYHAFSESLSVHKGLQQQAIRQGARPGDQMVHISQLAPPSLKSPDYEKLLAEWELDHGPSPAPPEIARLVPESSYFLHFRSMTAAGELFDRVGDWGDAVLRLFNEQALDHRLQPKLETQLIVRRDGLEKLFADGAVSEMAVIGADPYVLEGADVTFLFRAPRPEDLRKAVADWAAQAAQQSPDLVERTFNYRGKQVAARYTLDRTASSFMSEFGEFVILSNSHRAIRAALDAALGEIPSLAAAKDFRYLTALLPPSDDAAAAYFYVSDAFLRRFVGPAAKISEKRRLECFNNLVMLNNASMFYRLEHGASPRSLADLALGRFADTSRLVCPHGGAYAWDAARDACTCSLHNRLRYLTPNVELEVLTVSDAERQEYERYKARYGATWQAIFNPIAVRIATGKKMRLEACVLPTENGGHYAALKSWLPVQPQPLDSQQIAKSAVLSCAAAPGREAVAGFLKSIPGVSETLLEDPTLADLAWLGDRVSLHFCDANAILEVDPTRLRTTDFPLLGRTSLTSQASVAALLWATDAPVYVALDVEDRDKAQRLLEQMSARLFLKGGAVAGMPTTIDCYRMPDYKGRAIYAFSFRIYAVKVRLHVALIGDRLTASTTPEILRQAIDAIETPADATAPAAHFLVRFNLQGVREMYDDLDLHWSEKSRLACHRNAISIYNLVKLYETSPDDAPVLAEFKYGIQPFCPEGGAYAYDAARDRVSCSIHGHRHASTQHPLENRPSSFGRFMKEIQAASLTLRFAEEALFATAEIQQTE